MNNICKKESTEVIMNAFTMHVKVNEVVEKSETRVVRPRKRTKCFLGCTLPYPMQKLFSQTCTMESSGSSYNSTLINSVISSIEDISENDCSKD